jgi:hypothetical protein
MNLSCSPIVTAIVTVIMTAAVSMAPVSAQVLTVCASPAEASATVERFSSPRLADTIIPLGGRSDTTDKSLIALWKDEKGFDILVNWGRDDQHSLRADGAQILGMAPDTELVHLMVAHSDGGLEQFLFSLDVTGSGELLRSVSGDGPELSAICVKPH